MNEDDRVENVKFRSVPETPAGFPEESAVLLAARHESRLWEPRPVGEHVGAIVRGGNPDVLPSIGHRGGSAWKFTAAKEFQHDLNKHKQQLEGVIGAIVAICRDPMSKRGNTVKPLVGELQGMWRYRLGDFRLIYEPDTENSVVHCLGFKAAVESVLLIGALIRTRPVPIAHVPLRRAASRRVRTRAIVAQGTLDEYTRRAYRREVRDRRCHGRRSVTTPGARERPSLGYATVASR